MKLVRACLLAGFVFMTALLAGPLVASGQEADTTPPSITGVTPSQGAVLRATLPQFRATVSETGSGLNVINLNNSITVRIDGQVAPYGARVAAANSFAIVAFPLTPLAEGAHTWRVDAQDRAGNASTTGDIVFTVDLTLDGVTFGATAFSVKENAGRASIGLIRRPGATTSATVRFMTGSGSATPGTDYASTSETISFEPGETSKTIEVPILDDGVVEGNETVPVTLSQEGEDWTVSAMLTIVEDDNLNRAQFVLPPETLGWATGFTEFGLDGTAGTADDPGTNVVIVRVTDGELNHAWIPGGSCGSVHPWRSGKCFILGTGDGVTSTFQVDQTFRPIAIVDSVSSLQDLSSYIGSSTADGSSVSLISTPPNTPSGFDAVGVVDESGWERIDVAAVVVPATNAAIPSGSFSRASRIRVSVTDLADEGPSQPTVVALTIHGTSIDRLTLAQTPGDTEFVGTFATDSLGTATAVLDSTKYFMPEGLTYSTSGLSSGSAGFRLRIQETRTLIAQVVSSDFDDTDGGQGTDSSPWVHSVRIRSTAQPEGLQLTLWETLVEYYYPPPTWLPPAPPFPHRSTGVFQFVVADWVDWSRNDNPRDPADDPTRPKDSTPVLSRGVGLVDSDLLFSMLVRRVSEFPAAHQFTADSTLDEVIAALGSPQPGMVDDPGTPIDERRNLAGSGWVASTARSLGLDRGTTPWKYLAAVTLSVRHGDSVILSYPHVNGVSLNKTIQVDLSSPVIASAEPAIGKTVDALRPVFRGVILDSGSSLSVETLGDSITVSLDGAALPFGAVSPQPGRFDVLGVPAAPLSPGTHVWRMDILDRVGQPATTGDLSFTVPSEPPQPGEHQGVLSLVHPLESVPWITGFASNGPDGVPGSGDEPGDNIVRFRIEDADLNESSTTIEDSDVPTGDGNGTFSQTVQAFVLGGPLGLALTVIETDDASETPGVNSSAFRLAVANWADWSSTNDPQDPDDDPLFPKDSPPRLAKGFALIDPSNLWWINTRLVVSNPAPSQFQEDSSLSSVVTALKTHVPGGEQGELGRAQAADWVANTAAALGLAMERTSWRNLRSITLPVTDGAVVVIGYSDPDASARAKTTTVDLVPPAVTSFAPTHREFFQSTPTLTASFSDAGSGLDPAAAPETVRVIYDGVLLTDGVLIVATQSGFNLTASPPPATAEGTHTWRLEVVDRAGNLGTTGSIRFTVGDSVPPVITNVFPAHGGAVNTTSPQLRARVSDGGSGFSMVNPFGPIAVSVNGNRLGFELVNIAQDTFDLLVVPYAPLVGSNVWRVDATDRAGNMATTGDMVFTVDTDQPTVSSSLTGVGLRLKSGSSDFFEEFLSPEWLRITMDERIDPASIHPFDFFIEGMDIPIEALIAERVQATGEACDTSDGAFDEQCEMTDRRDRVYVRAARALGATERPKVVIVGAVSDLAGNYAPSGTAAGASVIAADGIPPTLTLAAIPAVGKTGETVSVTVSSDEPLVDNLPMVRVQGSNIELASVDTKLWQGAYTIASSGAFTVTADGMDTASNAAVQRTATFEGDTLAPTVSFSAIDTDLTRAGYQIPAGASVGVDGDEADEYTGDTHAKVFIHSASLELLDRLGGLVISTTPLDADDFQTTDEIHYTFGGTNRAASPYRLLVRARDEAGNLSTQVAVEFEIVGPTFVFSSANYSTPEGAGTASVRVLRTGDTGGEATVQIATNNDTATGGTDYTPISATLTFGPGETQKDVTVTILDDSVMEPDETLTLTLSNPAGGPVVGIPGSATLTIVDDDTTPPEVTAGPNRSFLYTGRTWSLRLASFSDPDPGETHAATIDWGDGTVTSGTINLSTGAISGTHRYAAPGTYMVIVTVTDSEGGVGTAEIEIIVRPHIRLRR